MARQGLQRGATDVRATATRRRRHGFTGDSARSYAPHPARPGPSRNAAASEAGKPPRPQAPTWGVSSVAMDAREPAKPELRRSPPPTPRSAPRGARTLNEAPNRLFPHPALLRRLQAGGDLCGHWRGHRRLGRPGNLGVAPATPGGEDAAGDPGAARVLRRTDDRPARPHLCHVETDHRQLALRRGLPCQPMDRRALPDGAHDGARGGGTGTRLERAQSGLVPVLFPAGAREPLCGLCVERLLRRPAGHDPGHRHSRESTSPTVPRSSPGTCSGSARTPIPGKRFGSTSSCSV